MIQLLFKKETYFALGGVLLFLGGIYLGYKLGIGKYYAYQLEVTQAVTEQRNRIAAANQYAKDKEAERIKEITKLKQELDTKVKELESEADKDPDANKPAISAPSSVRINKVNIPRTSPTNPR